MFGERPVNIWSQILYDLHPRVKKLLDELNTGGQIDHDEHGHPYVTSADRIEKDGKKTSTVQINLIRNGKAENIILHLRRRVDPVYSFNKEDGWKRMELPRIPVVKPVAQEGPRPERMKRFESYEALVDQIIGRK